jgi:hypothetical protein
MLNRLYDHPKEIEDMRPRLLSMLKRWGVTSTDLLTTRYLQNPTLFSGPPPAWIPDFEVRRAKFANTLIQQKLGMELLSPVMEEPVGKYPTLMIVDIKNTGHRALEGLRYQVNPSSKISSVEVYPSGVTTTTVTKDQRIIGSCARLEPGKGVTFIVSLGYGQGSDPKSGTVDITCPNSGETEVAASDLTDTEIK